jgi:hypothetical protein
VDDGRIFASKQDIKMVIEALSEPFCGKRSWRNEDFLDVKS